MEVNSEDDGGMIGRFFIKQGGKQIETPFALDFMAMYL